MKKIAILFTIAGLLLSCTSKKTKELANQVYETEEDSEFSSDERIRDLTKKIKAIEKDLDKTLEMYQSNGNFHRAMGIKMIHYKMFLKAYDHFNKAIEFFPNSEMLHYYRGLSAGQYAKSQDQDYITREYINRARISYEYSIELNPRFPKGLYALSILYVYELDRPNDAKALLDRLLKISTREFDAMLLRALLYEKDGELNRAIDLYDKVLNLSKNNKHISIATENRDKVLKRYVGD